LPDPFQPPLPAAAVAREQIQSGTGRRIITISRDLEETPVVPALRGGVRIERHGAGDLPRLLVPAMAPWPGLVGRRDHSAPTWSSGRGSEHDGDDEEEERKRETGRGARDCRVRVRERPEGEATRRKSLSGFSKRSSAATGLRNYRTTPLLLWGLEITAQAADARGWTDGRCHCSLFGSSMTRGPGSVWPHCSLFVVAVGCCAVGREFESMS
jgi:hypothetical protein